MVKKIALKLRKPVFLRRNKVMPCFDLLGQHPAILAGIARGQSGALLPRNMLDVHFDEVCIRDKSFPCVSQHKVIQSDGRSEERRVGKECRSRWSPEY